MALPRYVALKSKYNGKCLRYIDDDVQIHNYVQYSGDNVVSTYTKYELEPAKAGKDLVNIRSCYNNKYWVSASASSNWVVAVADEPEEDQSKWSCTLFDPIYDSTNGAYGFRHVKLGYNTCLWRVSGDLDSCLFMTYSSPDKDLCDLHMIVDWESLLVLPKHVAFKGDNGKYLASHWQEDHHYLEFFSNDIGNPRVGNQVYITSDGSLRFKSDYWGQFWRGGPTWIWADSNDTTDKNKATLFKPVRVSRNVVALRNLGNYKFRKRLSTEGKTNCLNAGITTISKEARLEIEELVLLRDI